MNHYILYGLTIESDVDLTMLLKADDGSIPDVYIREGKCADEVIDSLTKAGVLKKKYEIGTEYSCFMNKGGYFDPD